jgi:phosphoribosylanthranilate isomerase
MFVKICGITTKEAAYAAVEAEADFIGFVFAESKRKITPAEAREITSSLPSSIKKVGVFVNEPVDTILEVAKTARLDVIQLHGEESPDMIDALPYKVIKAIPATQDALKKIDTYSKADYFLIDSPYGKYRGGNGKTFDWKLLDTASIDRSKLILAGGLDALNVRKAIQQIAPSGVDVSSGVETNGKKDHEKIRAFISQAKQIERMKST